MNNREPLDVLKSKATNFTWFFVCPFFPLFLKKLWATKLWSKPLKIFLTPTMAMYSNLSCWSVWNLELFVKKGRTLDLHSMGPTITIQTVDHLWKIEIGYGFKFQPMIHCRSRENDKMGYASVKSNRFHLISCCLFFVFCFLYYGLLNYDPNHWEYS